MAKIRLKPPPPEDNGGLISFREFLLESGTQCRPDVHGVVTVFNEADAAELEAEGWMRTSLLEQAGSGDLAKRQRKRQRGLSKQRILTEHLASRRQFAEFMQKIAEAIKPLARDLDDLERKVAALKPLPVAGPSSFTIVTGDDAPLQKSAPYGGTIVGSLRVVDKSADAEIPRDLAKMYQR